MSRARSRYGTFKPAQGVAKPGYPDGVRTFTVAFDADTVDGINYAADQRDVSFSEMVRLLVEWGLMAGVVMKPAFSAARDED